jgi:GNAT superfamily N-acetyltransferase
LDVKINLRLAIYKDINEVSKLHYQYIPSGFLSSLGISFLNLLYKSMIDSKYAFCIVVEEEGKIIGFVSGTVSVGGFYKEFLKKNFLMASIILLPKFLNLKIARRIFETFFYPVKKEQNLPNAELLSIVVEKNYQGKGISQKLFERLVEEFSKKGINQFKVVVGSNLIPACKFYEKMGGVLQQEIEIHKGEKSRVYVWEMI